MLIRGEIIDMTCADGFMLLDESGTALLGLVTYIIRNGACEIVSLNSLRENCGIGTALVEKVKAHALSQQCHQLQLMTTNDNINAIRFYQKRGFDLVGINVGAIDLEREQKPQIPLLGNYGIPIRHELEFEMPL